jgi:hypothetical protein
MRFIILFLLLNSLEVAGQELTQNIRGVVKDGASGTPVEFAAVSLSGTDFSLGDITDSEGVFILMNIPLGRYDLYISSVGYEPALVRELLLTSGKEVILNLTIRESITVLEELVVTPKISKDEALNPMAAVSARMLSVEETQRYAGSIDDPARLASSFAGVSGNLSHNGISIRGNAPKFLQWRMEGIEIPNPNHFADLDIFGGGGLSALSNQMLANSDFLTGAFPAEYSNALSGVFDLFIRNGNNINHEHTFQLGAIGIDAASEGPLKKGGNSSYLFNYRYSTLALLSPLLPEGSEEIKYQDLSFKLNFPTKKSGIFSFWGIGLTDLSGPDPVSDSLLRKYEEEKTDYTNVQHMGVLGLSHRLFTGENTYLHTSLAASVRDTNLLTEKIYSSDRPEFYRRIRNTGWNFIWSTYVNSKISAAFTNKTGFSMTDMRYNLMLRESRYSGAPVATPVDEKGSSVLISAYSSSALRLNNQLTLNAGINGQLFTMTGGYTIEPRLGMKWQLSPAVRLGAGYGLHSRLERYSYYYSPVDTLSDGIDNKDLDFTRAHHVVLSLGFRLSENTMLRFEPYYQYLFNVPVIADSSYSLINEQSEWFIDDPLVSTGKGRNHGLDITLERFFSRGYYFLFTQSLFISEFKGGDNIWRNSLFNRNWLFNLLTGKEWLTGAYRRNVFGINIRISYMGGERYSPVNHAASMAAMKVIFDESRAFEYQLSPAFIIHFTTSIRLNKEKSSHEIALKFLNAGMYREFYNFRYNLIEQKVDEFRQPIIVPNLSYKIEF